MRRRASSANDTIVIVDFRQSLDRLVEEFEAAQVRYALIGGVALGLLGHARATLDIDLLIHKDDLGKADTVMGKLGYRKDFSNENVAQYEHSQVPAGRVDFLLAFRAVSLSMLGRATSVPIDTGHKARVAAPEDVIGLKVQSLVNDPRRKNSDLADIEALLALHGKKVDWQKLSEYFILFGMKDLYDELRGRFGGA